MIYYLLDPEGLNCFAFNKGAGISAGFTFSRREGDFLILRVQGWFSYGRNLQGLASF